ncbi:MAG: clostripain-related cysteine peptidase [Bacteroidaceae bacterium]
MQCIEVDYALRHATDYVIASPISTPAIGANYTTLVRDGLFKDDVSQIAASYYNYIVSLPLDVYSDFGMVISCVRTSELEKPRRRHPEVYFRNQGL